MMTVIEQRTCEAICSLATALEKEAPKVSDQMHCLPRIAKALESIAESLKVLRGNQNDQPKPRDDYGETGG